MVVSSRPLENVKYDNLFSRRGRAKMAKKSTKKRYARAKLLFCTASFWYHSQLPTVGSCE